MINNRIKKIRELMKEKNIDIYLIPTADFHESENVAEYFKARVFISGFTGSAGTIVITKDESILWADGRYFIQAENQIKDTEIQLYKMGQEGVPTIIEYCKNHAHLNIGFDGRVITAKMGETIEKECLKKGGSVQYELDLVDQIWTDRPSMPFSQAFYLSEKYTGKTMKEKLEWLKKEMKSKADVLVLSALDEIAWLFNIRGNDVAFTPVIYAYALISENKVDFYVDKNKLNEEIAALFNECNVELHDYFSFYDDIRKIENQIVWCDLEQINYAIKKGINKTNQLVLQRTPIVLEKACKNETEIKNIRESHLKDGVAMVRFIKWLKENIKTEEISEITAADYLEKCRVEGGAFELSFPTICGYNANAAMMHYSATPENYAMLKPAGIVLVDSGGQYLEGTTDITRTIALGPVSDEWKKYNTTVLKGMINLSKAKFLSGMNGLALDILARGPVWNLDIDYQCGTGHGVGYCLGVHEGPHGVRWRNPSNAPMDPFMQGMVVTNEPGIYLGGELGIRIENELIVQKGIKNFYGQFMYFETVTFCPIDVDLIDSQYLSKEELSWLNDYHQEVYDKLSPRLDDECSKWLYKVTRPVQEV